MAAAKPSESAPSAASSLPCVVSAVLVALLAMRYDILRSLTRTTKRLIATRQQTSIFVTPRSHLQVPVGQLIATARIPGRRLQGVGDGARNHRFVIYAGRTVFLLPLRLAAVIAALAELANSLQRLIVDAVGVGSSDCQLPVKITTMRSAPNIEPTRSNLFFRRSGLDEAGTAGRRRPQHVIQHGRVPGCSQVDGKR